ncbi:MAG: hypothetical protein AB2690_21435 [Candidatus Thiodiazotropha endolucinida]
MKSIIAVEYKNLPQCRLARMMSAGPVTESQAAESWTAKGIVKSV